MQRCIVFRVDSSIDFAGDTWRLAPCPGAELAVIHTARALSETGHHDVHVVCRTSRPGSVDGVTYHSLAAEPRVLSVADVIVHVRDYWQGTSLHGSPGARHVLWLHDTTREILSLCPGTPCYRDLGVQLARYDALVFVSEWHRAEVLTAAGTLHGMPPSVAFHHPLPACAAGNPLERRAPFRLLHSAHPRKALRALLESWPTIVRALPHAELVLCGHPSIYQETETYFDGARSSLSQILERYPKEWGRRINLLPAALPQMALQQEVQAATLLLHPDTSIETGATTVLEALAGGTVPVVSDLGCLPELCAGRGVITPRGPRFAQRFAEDVIALLRDPDRRQRLARAGRAWAHPLTDAHHLGTRWSKLIDRSIAEPRRAPSPCLLQAPSAVHRPSFRVLNADELPEQAWTELTSSTSGAWLSHTRAWYEAVERADPATRACWRAIVDRRGRALAIVPAAVSAMAPGILLSGLFEPSGPLLREDIEADLVGPVAEQILQILEDIAYATRSHHVQIKFPSVCGAGLGVRPTEFLTRARLNRYAPVETETFAALQECSLRPSARAVTQLRRASEHCQVVLADEPHTIDLALELHHSHSHRKQAWYLKGSALRALQRDRDNEVHLFLVKVDGKPAGFALGLGYRRAATLQSWGVEHWALPHHAAKRVVVDAVRYLLQRGASVVECGGVPDVPGPHDGLTEFYRRLGGRRIPALHLERHNAPAPEPEYTAR